MGEAFILVVYWAVCAAIIAAFANMLIKAIMVDKTFSAVEGAVILAVNMVALGILLPIFGQNAFGIFTVFIAVFALVIFMVKRSRDQQKLREFHEKDIQVALKKLEEKPDMVAAYEKLGDLYLKENSYDLAIENYEQAVKYTENKPDNVVMKSKLKSAKIAKERFDSRKPSIIETIADTLKRLE